MGIFSKIKKEADKKSIIWIILIIIVIILIILNLIPVIYDEFEINSENITEAKTTCFRNCTTHKFNFNEIEEESFSCQCKTTVLKNWIGKIFKKKDI